MARNVEIKARIESVESLLERAFTVADEESGLIEQDDTFFHCGHGRLKLRDLGDDRGELIFYRRLDRAGPKTSHYLISPVTSCRSMRELLEEAHGQVGRVRKRRMLFTRGRTRIHLDRVEGLGDFLELEVVLRAGEPEEVGIAEAEDLLDRLGIDRSALVEGAYLDLMLARS
ncbi:MAG: class IV adenylate cyclase [Planctomycetes bacterium]|nr:class IV adenylate cyclase [Planctomycetota bacterium]